MTIMRKIIGFALVCALCSSCFGSYYETDYVGVSNFEYDNTETEFPDSVYIKGPQFYSGSTYLEFATAYSEDTDTFEGGFAFSMKRDSSLVISPDNKYPNLTAYPTSSLFLSNGTAASEGFAVFYDSYRKPSKPMRFARASMGTCTMQYCMVTNTQPVVKYFLEENSEAAANGDYLKLTATGYLGGKETGKAEYMLADFRGGSDSLVVAWKVLDLSKLGKIDECDFRLESADNDNKQDFLRYFCLDNIVAKIYMKE